MLDYYLMKNAFFTYHIFIVPSSPTVTGISVNKFPLRVKARKWKKVFYLTLFV